MTEGARIAQGCEPLHHGRREPRGITKIWTAYGTPAVSRRISQEQGMNKDQVKGRVKEVEGKIKAATGKLVGNKTLEAKGKMQQTAGEIQANYGDLKSDMKRGG